MRNFQPKSISSKPESLSPDHTAARGVCFGHSSSKGDLVLSDLSALSRPPCL